MFLKKWLPFTLPVSIGSGPVRRTYQQSKGTKSRSPLPRLEHAQTLVKTLVPKQSLVKMKCRAVAKIQIKYSSEGVNFHLNQYVST